MSESNPMAGSNSSFLKGRYSVFGKVINGFEILENLESKDYLLKIEFNN